MQILSRTLKWRRFWRLFWILIKNVLVILKILYQMITSKCWYRYKFVEIDYLGAKGTDIVPNYSILACKTAKNQSKLAKILTLERITT